MDTISHEAELSVIQDFPKCIEELEKILQVSLDFLEWFDLHSLVFTEFKT